MLRSHLSLVLGFAAVAASAQSPANLELHRWRTTDGHEAKAVFGGIDADSGTLTVLVPKQIPLSRLDPSSRAVAERIDSQARLAPGSDEDLEFSQNADLAILRRQQNILGPIAFLGLHGFTIDGGNEMNPRWFMRSMTGVNHLEAPQKPGVSTEFRFDQHPEVPDESSWGGWCFMKQQADGKPTERSVIEAWANLATYVPDMNPPGVRQVFVDDLVDQLDGLQQEMTSHKSPVVRVNPNLILKAEINVYPEGDGHGITLGFAHGPFLRDAPTP